MKLDQGPSSRGTPMALAEINVTPLVDVMLVLLVIFMITAPMMQQGVQLDLPKANTGAIDEAPNQIHIQVRKDRSILLNDTRLAKGELRKKLTAIAKAKPGVQVFVQADQSLSYGFIAQVIAEVKQAQLTRIGLVTLPAERNSHL